VSDRFQVGYDKGDLINKSIFINLRLIS